VCCIYSTCTTYGTYVRTNLKFSYIMYVCIYIQYVRTVQYHTSYSTVDSGVYGRSRYAGRSMKVLKCTRLARCFSHTPECSKSLCVCNYSIYAPLYCKFFSSDRMAKTATVQYQHHAGNRQKVTYYCTGACRTYSAKKIFRRFPACCRTSRAGTGTVYLGTVLYSTSTATFVRVLYCG
jgi:hypothetical protein